MATGCYVDKYLPTSFKGIPFEGLDVTSEHGRRGAEGEFPFGEETAYADLGRSIRRYSISGRIVTNDHILVASALIAAVETPGPGILVHPTRGPLFVACKNLKVRDNPIEEQGVTYVDLEFVEANLFPNGLAVGSNLLGLAINVLATMFAESFNDNYHPENVTFYDRAAVLETSGTAVNSIYVGFQQAASDVDDTKVYRALASMQTLASDNGLLTDPAVLSEAITKGYAYIDRYSSSPKKQLLFRQIINANGADVPVGRTAVDTVNAVQAFMRGLGAGYLAKSYLETSPRDMNEAFSQYDTVFKAFKQELDIAKERCDNRLYIQLAKYFEDVKALMMNRAYSSPSLVSYDFGRPVHSLVAAYSIHDDASRMREIEEKNPFSFPWQVGPKVVAVRT